MILNKIIMINKYPMPNVEDIFDCLRRARIFSNINLKVGSQSVEQSRYLVEDDMHHLIWLLWVPYHTFWVNECLNHILCPNKLHISYFFKRIVIVYFDDIFIYSHFI